MPHEMRNRGGHASACSLRSVFTWYKHAGESWDVGDSKRYADLSKCHPIVSDFFGKEEIANLRTSTTAMMIIFIPPELMMNEEFTKETAVVQTQVENKHESRNRKALSWITRKRWREVPSRKTSATTSAVSSYACLWMAIVDISGSFTHRLA